MRRTNPLIALLVFAGALAVLLVALGVVPSGLRDLLERAVPVVLVILGLAGLLRGRIPLSGLIALIGGIALVAGLTTIAFSSRATEQRTDFQQPISQPLRADAPLMRVRVETLAVDVEVAIAPTSDGIITGEFIGSPAKRIDLDYSESADGSVDLIVREVEMSDGFPSLDALGRGTLRLILPRALPLDFSYESASPGSVTLDLGDSALERLNVTLPRGDVAVRLPNYAPAYSQAGDLLGTLAARGGTLTLFVPSAVAARLELDRGGSGIEPQYDPNLYNYLVGDVLEARTAAAASVSVRYGLAASRIRVEVSS